MKNITVQLNDNQLGFLKHLLQNVQLRGVDAPMFMELVELIRRAEHEDSEVGTKGLKTQE